MTIRPSCFRQRHRHAGSVLGDTWGCVDPSPSLRGTPCPPPLDAGLAGFPHALPQVGVQLKSFLSQRPTTIGVVITSEWAADAIGIGPAAGIVTAEDVSYPSGKELVSAPPVVQD